jgi:hypothetical protein
MVRKGVERLVDAQKCALDIAASQGTAAKGLTEGLLMVGAATASGMAERAEQVFVSCVEAQKSVLDLAEFVGKSIEGIAAAQRAVLDVAATQYAAVAGAVKQQMESCDVAQLAGFADSMKLGVQSVIELQKKFLDLTVEQGAAASKIAREATIPTSPTEIADLARKGAEVLVDTQKRLLDIALQGVARAAKASAE